MSLIMEDKRLNAKLFLKWAGGNTQLLNELEVRLPENIKSTKVIDSYVEPFVGGGALFFFLRNRYKINKANNVVNSLVKHYN
ncbi:DNA adenine methylase [Candidatus Parcubacteria bacterium]|nr:DNA adenine methylase [Candidatus Parcubacteria bacterium]